MGESRLPAPNNLGRKLPRCDYLRTCKCAEIQQVVIATYNELSLAHKGAGKNLIVFGVCRHGTYVWKHRNDDCLGSQEQKIRINIVLPPRILPLNVGTVQDIVYFWQNGQAHD
ncbi:MAG: hypothetical protein WBH57_07785 [Anaerolineae bacterium]